MFPISKVICFNGINLLFLLLKSRAVTVSFESTNSVAAVIHAMICIRNTIQVKSKICLMPNVIFNLDDLQTLFSIIKTLKFRYMSANTNSSNSLRLLALLLYFKVINNKPLSFTKHIEVNMSYIPFASQ